MKQIKEKKALQTFAQIYLECSGFPIPEAYLCNAESRVFGIFRKNELISGFIMNGQSKFRTVEIFEEEKRKNIYEKLGDPTQHTEVSCFWIKREFRTNTFLNFYIWFALAYALKQFGNRYFVFGTRSHSLARLYSHAKKAVLITNDFIEGKPMYIFWGRQSDCISGILDIMRFKLRRILKIAGRKYVPANG